MTSGITSLCLHRGFFFAPIKVATLDGLPTDAMEGASDGAADKAGDYCQNSLATQIRTGQRQAGGSSNGKENWQDCEFSSRHSRNPFAPMLCMMPAEPPFWHLKAFGRSISFMTSSIFGFMAAHV